MNDAVNDPEILEMLYWGEGLSTPRIADRLGVHRSTVYKKMVQFGIDRRGVGYNSYTGDDVKKTATYSHKDGYPVWHSTRDADGFTDVRVHQLLAIAKGYDPKEVFDPHMHVHHKNGIRWDNREENIELLTDREHGKHHAEDMGTEYYQEIGSRNGYTDEEIIEWLTLFVEELGFTPACDDLIGWPGPTPETIRNHFGSFPAAIEEAGYEPRCHESNRKDYRSEV